MCPASSPTSIRKITYLEAQSKNKLFVWAKVHGLGHVQIGRAFGVQNYNCWARLRDEGAQNLIALFQYVVPHWTFHPIIAVHSSGVQLTHRHRHRPIAMLSTQSPIAGDNSAIGMSLLLPSVGYNHTKSYTRQKWRWRAHEHVDLCSCVYMTSSHRSHKHYWSNMRLTFTAVSASAVAARHSTALLMTRAAASPMDIMGHWSDSAERTQIHIHIWYSEAFTARHA